MSNVQPNSQMVECDNQTAELHMAMAEMMEEDEGDRNAEQGQGNQLDVMQFTVARIIPMENKIRCTPIK